ncbi:MAG: XRE family transcriptional regulator [Kiritimatiellia bacterium]|jgi:transcriptional regulator with XRE-family HTH domain|nr:XRE family transcriptional regulator [Kiritimatiellia bacterium]MDP6630973.1 XRE family transcriptional regulator [Kiritimatiellia bacterium]MDP6810278.1 XRE family transcriptional regulator [Kiritimatiellia bacterium]MDP7022733.1 XRE family transcriptional regulator [Kiritimatiellia bacterium]
MGKTGEHVAKMYNFAVLRDLRRQRGLTIAELSAQTGISPAVISKLERNQAVAGLGTLFRLGRGFGITAAELLALIESRTAQCKQETDRVVEDFHFRQIEFANAKCYYADAPKGAKRSNPDAHRDEYEICWVLEGAVKVALPHETHILSAGDCVQFDALFEHTYEVLEDCRIIIQHIHKQKRF